MTEPASFPTPLLDQKPDLELRRSSRSNRGKNSRFEIEDQFVISRTQASSSSSRNKRKRAHQPSLIVNADSSVDDSIRCICNKVYENDEQMMVQCEKCDKWQHVRCLFGKEDDSLLPEIYFCHICDPELYAELITLAAAASNVTEVTSSVVNVATPVDALSEGVETVASEACNSSIDESSDISRTLVKESSQSLEIPIPQPVSQTQYFYSLPVTNLTSLQAPSIADMTDIVRKSVATAFLSIFKDHIVPIAISNKDVELSEPDTLTSFAEKLSMQLEQALYDTFASSSHKLSISSNTKSLPTKKSKKARSIAPTGPVDVGSKYRSKFRSLAATLKDDANPLLHKKIVTGELSPLEFVNLSSEELMNPALRQMAEAVRAESIRNSILKVEEGPRIRRTHKGEVYIDDEIHGGAGTNENVAVEMESAWMPIGNSKLAENKQDDNGENNKSNSTTGSDNETKTKNEGSPESVSEKPKSATPPLVLEMHHNEINQHEDLYHNNNDQSENHVNVTIEDDDDLDAILNNSSTTSNNFSTTNPTSKDSAATKENEFYVPTATEAIIFHGKVLMPTIAEFSTQAVHLSGPHGFNPTSASTGWPALLPSTLIVEGRLDKAVAAKYLASVGQSKDIVSFMLRPNRDDKLQFDKLYNYFRLKHKYGVIGKKRSSVGNIMVKDSYILPLQKGDEIPEHLWLGTTAAHVSLDAALAADSRVIVCIFVLSHRLGIQNARSITPPQHQYQDQQQQKPHQQQKQQKQKQNQPIVAAEKAQELLAILSRINSDSSALPSTSHSVAPDYSIENDDDYEP